MRQTFALFLQHSAVTIKAYYAYKWPKWPKCAHFFAGSLSTAQQLSKNVTFIHIRHPNFARQINGKKKAFFNMNINI